MTSIALEKSSYAPNLEFVFKGAAEKSSSAPNLEFVFKGAGKRVKLSPPFDVTLQWEPKGSYRLEHVIKFCNQVPAQPCALFPQRRKIG